MLSTFGWKAAIAVLVNATIAVFVLRKHLNDSTRQVNIPSAIKVPATLIFVHLAFLAGVVSLAHHPVAFLGLFLMFLGFSQAYERHQSPLIIKEALRVAFFLAGYRHIWQQSVRDQLSRGGVQ
jgi:amino acid transporter